MGEYADMAIDDMLSYDEYLLQHPDEDDDPDMGWSPFTRFRRDRRRKKILKCQICGQSGLHWLNEDGKWYLGDYDIDNDFEETRHVCKMKGKFKKC